MAIKIQIGNAIISCDRIDEFERAVQVLGLSIHNINDINTLKKPQLISPTQSSLFVLIPPELIEKIRNSNQEKYLDLLTNNPTGIVTSEIVKKLGLKSIFDFNGIWSGEVRNFKKYGIPIESITKRERDKKTKEIKHIPTSEIIDAWGKIKQG